ncbi:MAG: alpha-L-fucosidase, partial [Calditrichota bacterium]
MAVYTRRTFLQRLATAGIASLFAPASLFNAEHDPASSARPTPAQLAWQDAEVGVIFHFDLPVAAGEFAPNNSGKKRLDPAKYNPRELDTDQWLEAAKTAGARYAVFTATHFNGFLQWQSDLYPYGVKQSPWRNGRGDVVADFVNSCHKYNIQPALYLSTHCNAYWTVWNHYVDWGAGRGTPQQAAFNRVAEQMTAELCSRYGPLLEIWYDAGVKTPAEGGPDVLPIVEKYQPDIVFYHNKQRADHRWIGNEDGYAG